MSRDGWQVRRADDPAAAGSLAAALVTRALGERLAVAARATLALSGGSTPAPMLQALAAAPAALPWDRVDVVQVDERTVASDHDDRNLAMLRRELLDHVPAVVHPMQVEHGDGVAAGAAATGATLTGLLAPEGRLDVVHLGLGDDGHTASLFPGDPVLDVDDVPVAVAGEQAGHRRMTLTRPVLEAARTTVLLVTGAGKRDALRRVLDRDRSLPAGALDLTDVTVVTDLDVG